jgi:hypothetical protein
MDQAPVLATSAVSFIYIPGRTLTLCRWEYLDLCARGCSNFKLEKWRLFTLVRISQYCWHCAYSYLGLASREGPAGREPEPDIDGLVYHLMYSLLTSGIFDNDDASPAECIILKSTFEAMADLVPEQVNLVPNYISQPSASHANHIRDGCRRVLRA